MRKTTVVVEALRRHGPLTSQFLAEALVQDGAGPTAARKLIERSRRNGEVQSTYPVRFDKAYLYFLKSHEGKTYARALKALLSQKPAFNRIYKALLANRGWITRGQIGKLSGCLPEGDDSGSGGRLPLGKLIDQLQHVGLIDEASATPDIYRLGRQFGPSGVQKSVFQKKLELEQSLLIGFLDWLRDCFLLGYESNTMRSSPTTATPFNQGLWDVHGPVYCGPLTKDTALRRIGTAEDFLVGEILGFRQYNINDAEATIERVRNISSRWKTISLTSLVLAPSFSVPAWKQLRELGIVPLVFRRVFGRNMEELLRQFWKALSVNGEATKQLDEIEKSLELTKGTVADDGLLGNLKGTLFELLIALALRTEGFDTTLQKIIRKLDEDVQYEVDVTAIRGQSLCRLVECKGRHADYKETPVDIQRHFHNRCKVASDPFGWNVTELYDKVEAVFVTSGQLDHEAARYANEHKRSHGIDCLVIDRAELLEWLRRIGQPRLVEIVERYY